MQLRPHWGTYAELCLIPKVRFPAKKRGHVLKNCPKYWDTERRLTLGRPLKGHTDTITSLAFSPDGMLYSASTDGTVGVWPVSLTAWQQQACRIAHRNLTRTEWRIYVGDRPYEETCPDLPNP